MLSVRLMKAMVAGLACAAITVLGAATAAADDADPTPTTPPESLAAELPGAVPGDTPTDLTGANPGAAPAVAPAYVPPDALIPGMNPAAVTVNPDGSLVYHGTTPVGVETPGWSVISSADGIVMVHGPVAPPPPAAAEVGADLTP